MNVSAHIFRAYDIRGEYPKYLNEKIAFHVGRAIGTLVRRKKGVRSFAPPKVVLGMDDRESSPKLTEALAKGLINSGCNVTDIGVTLTPVIHFLTTTQPFDVGVNVTASHNPKEFNGFRLDFEGACPFTSEEIQKLYEFVTQEDYEVGMGQCKRMELNYLYSDFLCSQFNLDKKFKIIVDCGNGASSIIAPHIFEKIGCEVAPMYCAFDSSFPYGTPDPESSLVMTDLNKKVLELGADIGVAFDTDGDRLGVVDDRGNIYHTDQLLLLFAEEVLAYNPGATVVYDVKCSNLLDILVKEFGGVPKMLPTGHIHFLQALKHGAILGGEFSGHVLFKDKYFGFDDGIYAVLRLLEILDNRKKPLSEVMSHFPKKVNSPELKVSCPDEKKFDIVDTIKRRILPPKKFEVDTLDGARVSVTDSGWFLIRASNTSPYLSVRAEGATKKELDWMLAEVRDILSNFSFLNLDAIPN